MGKREASLGLWKKVSIVCVTAIFLILIGCAAVPVKSNEGRSDNQSAQDESLLAAPLAAAGKDGKSAYELYVDGGGAFTQEQWLASLAQGAPEWAESREWLAEHGEQEKLYVLPDGHIWSYFGTDRTVSIELLHPENIIIGTSGGSHVTGTPGIIVDYDSSLTGVWTNFDMSAIPSDTAVTLHITGAGSQSSGSPVFMMKYGEFAKAGPLQLDDMAIRSQYASSTNLKISNETPSSFTLFVGQDISGNNISEYDTIKALYFEFNTKNISGISVRATYTITGPQWVDTRLTYTPSDNEDRIVILENETAQLKTDVAALSKGATSDPPAYWVEAVDVLAETVEERQSDGGVQAFQFVWFSDMHGVTGYHNSNGAGTSNQANIGKVAQYLCERFNIPLVATSGDIMSQASHADVSNVYNEYAACRDILSYIDTERLMATIGNHDGAWGAPVNNVYYLRDIGNRALYNQVFRCQAMSLSREFGVDGTYFYVDSHPQKVRFVMLNSNTDGDGSSDADGNAVYNSMKNSVYGTEQLRWLVEVLNTVPEGYTVIAMAHQPLNTSKDGNLVARIFTAYNEKVAFNGSADLQGDYWGKGLINSYTSSVVDCDFSKAKGEFAAFFHGHIHKDTIDTATYSFPCISITTAGADVRDENPIERVPGTATETAMDIVTLDMANRKIYMTRLGAGSDRETEY